MKSHSSSPTTVNTCSNHPCTPPSVTQGSCHRWACKSVPLIIALVLLFTFLHDVGRQRLAGPESGDGRGRYCPAAEAGGCCAARGVANASSLCRCPFLAQIVFSHSGTAPRCLPPELSCPRLRGHAPLCPSAPCVVLSPCVCQEGLSVPQPTLAPLPSRCHHLWGTARNGASGARRTARAKAEPGGESQGAQAGRSCGPRAPPHFHVGGGLGRAALRGGGHGRATAARLAGWQSYPQGSSGGSRSGQDPAPGRRAKGIFTREKVELRFAGRRQPGQAPASRGRLAQESQGFPAWQRSPRMSPSRTWSAAAAASPGAFLHDSDIRVSSDHHGSNW